MNRSRRRQRFIFGCFALCFGGFARCFAVFLDFGLHGVVNGGDLRFAERVEENRLEVGLQVRFFFVLVGGLFRLTEETLKLYFEVVGERSGRYAEVRSNFGLDFSLDLGRIHVWYLGAMCVQEVDRYLGS